MRLEEAIDAEMSTDLLLVLTGLTMYKIDKKQFSEKLIGGSKF